MKSDNLKATSRKGSPEPRLTAVLGILDDTSPLRSGSPEASPYQVDHLGLAMEGRFSVG